MKTKTETKALAKPSTLAVMLPAVFAVALGATIIFLAGHAQSATLHDAAHDMRHASGFPCH